MSRKLTQSLAAGISSEYRELLSTLNRQTKGPFSVTDAIKLLKLPSEKIKKLLPYLAKKEWLKRIRQGVYITVPLEAQTPRTWTEDEWIVGTNLFSPCYIGGWSAAQYFELTEQHFRSIVIYTTKRVRNPRQTIDNISYIVRTIKKERLFGVSSAWIKEYKISVSNPSKTIVDLLDTPSLGGGIRHVAQILNEYFQSKYRDDKLLKKYLELINNGTAYKRLGFLIEKLKINAPEICKLCLKKVKRGDVYLDPDLQKDKGNPDKKWHLFINASVN